LALGEPLLALARRQGVLWGRLQGLGFETEALLRATAADVVTTSAIEGEMLDPGAVRSSVARRLGIEEAGLELPDRRIDGVVDMMVDATREASQPLTVERLWQWHRWLFPAAATARRASALAGPPLVVGAWRDDRLGPMEVVSGAIGRERVHFTAPATGRLHDEVVRFLAWFEGNAVDNAVIKAGVAHLWFVTLHPFDDGNGRIARAIADMALSRGEGGQRFYSVSTRINRSRQDYYDILEATQHGDLDVTPWLLWFVGCVGDAVDDALAHSARSLDTGRFWSRHVDQPFNERQRTMLNRLLGEDLVEVKSAEWARLCRCSPDTALRDIDDLVGRSILEKGSAGGRSTRYRLLRG
jgi:Fic family protein